MSEKKVIYVNGYCKAIQTQFGEIINFEVNPNDLNMLPKNDKGFVKLSMMKRREPGKYGETHYMKLNDYVKPEWEAKQVAKQTQDNYDLPW